MKIRLLIILTIWVLQSCADLTSDERLEFKIKESVISDKKELNFKDLTDFEWDSLLVLTPYTESKRIGEKFQIDLAKVEHVGMESRDDIVLLVFLLDKKVIRTVEYPRCPGEFIQQEIDFIPKDKAIFKKVVTDRLNSRGDKSIELIRK